MGAYIIRYMTLFESCGPDPVDGKLSGARAKQEMLKSNEFPITFEMGIY